jgi:hypothetical protein
MEENYKLTTCFYSIPTEQESPSPMYYYSTTVARRKRLNPGTYMRVYSHRHIGTGNYLIAQAVAHRNS